MRFILALIFCAFLIDASADNNRYYSDPETNSTILTRIGYRLGYDNTTKLATWVAYRLTFDKLTEPSVERSNNFQVDHEVLASADPKDYVHTGFDRGHLAPAADMSSSEEEMQESFLMTNISPQLPSFNRGIWKNLERAVRIWARRESSVYVITGPILSREATHKTIGKNQIPVPEYFYKVILDETEPRKMIGFIIPNSATTNSFWSFAMSVDDVEAFTGLDFFRGLPGERKLESKFNRKDW